MFPPSTDLFGTPYPTTNGALTVQMGLPPSPPSEMTRRIRGTNGKLVQNDDWPAFIEGAYLLRANWIQALIDPRRDMDRECGYPYLIIPKQYRQMYDREGIAARVVDIYPDECWAVDPKVYENAEDEDTPFEDAWKELADNEHYDPLHYLHRIDCLSGVGRYGVLLLGLDDGLDLSQPVDGIDEFDQPTWGPGKRKNKSPGHQLIYLRAFDEMLGHIISFEKNPSNPRFGKPLFYHLLFADIRVGDPGMTAAAISVTSRIVHWTRVLHVADNRETSEVFGVPRMQSVFNRLCDVRKVLGGSAEMFWKGGFPGLSFELLPELTTAGVTLDRKSLDEQFERYSNGLQRYLAIVGLSAKSLAPQVANPDPTLKTQLEAIAISKGVPLRIFTGSEQAQLASGQDVRTWNRRLIKRMTKYISPKILKPFVQRLINFGCIPPPESGRFKVFWPDINIPQMSELSQIADRQSAAMMKYVTGGVSQIIDPENFLLHVIGLTSDQVKVIMKGIKTTDVEVIPPAVAQAAVRDVEAAEVKAGSPGGGGN